MAQKSANVYARIEPDVKQQAEEILTGLGMSASSAINVFYKQIILQKGLPFEVKFPAQAPVDLKGLTRAQFDAELEKGYVDMQSGNVKKADEVFEALHRELNL